MKRSLLGNAMANVVQMVVGTALLLLLYRYINMRLGTAALGIWSVVLAMGSASRLADFGISASVTRFVARYLALDDGKGAAAVVETALLTLLAFLAGVLPLLYLPLSLVLTHVFSGDELEQAQALLPYALVSLGLAILSAVVQSGLNGIQRMDLRAGLVLTAQLLFVTLAFWVVPSQGLVGLAWAQIAQGIVSLIGGWLLLRRYLNGLSRFPLGWSRSHFREMLGYGVNVQAATLLMLAMDPLTKALLARFGGAEAAGLFEMANQIAIKIRSLIVAANQAIVPRVAQLKEKTPHLLNDMYARNFRVIFYISLPLFSALYVWSGEISQLLVGELHASFLKILYLLLAAWLLNLFTGPAYFVNLGMGQPGRNTIAHALMAGVNILLGWSLGTAIGGMGVVFAYALAVTTGSAFLIIDHQRRSSLSFESGILKNHGGLVIISALAMTGGFWIWHEDASLSLSIRNILSAGLTCLLLSAVWLDPYRRVFLDMVKRR